MARIERCQGTVMICTITSWLIIKHDLVQHLFIVFLEKIGAFRRVNYEEMVRLRESETGEGERYSD